MLETFLASTVTVAVAEIGDKTQLLSLLLATRFRNYWAIVAGILVATVVNHGGSAWLGDWLMAMISPQTGRWLVAGSFFAVAAWVLIPDSSNDGPGPLDRYGAFVATTTLFFVAELGDKTQVATVILAAQYQSVWLVTAGTTLGMLAANIPVVWAGEKLMRRLPLRLARYGACLLFVLLGIATLIS